MAMDVSKITTLFKDKLAKQLIMLEPEEAKVLKEIEYSQGDKDELGRKYVQPIQTGMSGGITFNKDGSAFLLNGVVPSTTSEALVEAHSIVLQEALSYAAISRASNSEKAFMSSIGFAYKNMKASLTKVLEVLVLYGQTGLGTIGAVTASGSDKKIVITNATFAPGIWSGTKGHKFDAYNGSTKINTNAPLVVKKVNLNERSIIVSGNSTDLAALDEDHVLYYYNSKAAEMAGLDKIITNTGTLFGVDASEVEMWQGNVVDLQGEKLTLEKVVKALSLAGDKGLSGNVVGVISSETFASLVADADKLRSLDASYSSKIERGHDEIVFLTDVGKVKFITSTKCKRGDAFFFPKSKTMRIGSQEENVSFNIPGQGDQIFMHMPNNAGVEFRLFTDQAVFVERPDHCLKITGIDNNAAE